jgi:hypothetical protein
MLLPCRLHRQLLDLLRLASLPNLEQEYNLLLPNLQYHQVRPNLHHLHHRANFYQKNLFLGQMDVRQDIQPLRRYHHLL